MSWRPVRRNRRIGSSPSRPKRAIVVGVLLIVITYAGFPTPRAEAATTFQALTHNIAGFHDDEVRYITASSAPLVVNVQEVCEYRYSDLVWHLGTRGYGTAAYIPRYNSTFCWGDVYMIHATRGDFARTEGDVLAGSFPSSIQAAGDGARRGYVCVRAGIYYQSWWGCSTHITPNSAYFAAAQSNHMRSIAFYLNDRAVIVGGDFNRLPDEPSMPEWYWSFHEGDERISERTQSRGKIDYVWSIRGRTNAAFGDAQVGCGGISDHCYLLSTHQFLP